MTEGVQAPEGDIQTFAADLWVEDTALLCDEAALTELLRAAAAEGGATVLGGDAHVFPNGALTIFLILAQSHLSLHTWPEHHLANVDLFSYGPIRGDRVIAALKHGLGATSSNVVRLLRSVSPEPP